MAMILEIRDARGVSTLHRLDKLPVTIGRALSNDIILDDPYVDGRHASIGTDDAGVLTVEDLGSLNGLRRNGTREAARVAVEPGTELRIGRSLLRFRDVEEVVAPALADEDAPKPLPSVLIADAAPPRSRLLGTTAGRLGIAATMIAAFALAAWLGSTARSNGTAVLSVVLIVAVATLVWAGLWTMAGRGSDRRSNLLGHYAVASLALMAMLGWDIVNSWLAFLFPDAAIIPALYLAVFLSVLTAVVAGHLGVSGSMPRNARWRVGVITSAVVVALFFFVGLVNDEKFTDVPKFAAEVKPVPAQFIPTMPVSEFGGVAKELKDDVDEALAKQVDRDAPVAP